MTKIIRATKKFQKSGPFDWDKSSSEIQRAKFAAKREAAAEQAAAPQSVLDSVERLVRQLTRGDGAGINGIVINASCGLSALRTEHGALSADYEALAADYVEKRLLPLSLDNRYRRLAYGGACSDDRQRDAMLWDFELLHRDDLSARDFSRYVYVALAKSFGWFIYPRSAEGDVVSR